MTDQERNPAFAPVAPVPQEKRYRVVGTQRVFDHAPGEEFNATLPFDQEEMFITYGQLQVVSGDVENLEPQRAPEQGQPPEPGAAPIVADSTQDATGTKE